MGCRNETDRKLTDVERALNRAVSGEYTAVLFPWNFFEHSERSQILELCAQKGLQVILRLPSRALSAAVAKEVLELVAQGVGVNVVWTTSSPISREALTELEKKTDSVYYTFSVFDGDDVVATLKKWPSSLLQRLFFHFSYHLKPEDRRMGCHQIHQLIQRINREIPSISVRPTPGIEMWDPRIDPELCMEPMIAPQYVSLVDEKLRRPLQVSIVIPSYNNRRYLANTFKHLLRQTVSPQDFEIIIVDDGSDDGSEETLVELARPYFGKINFKYIYSPRTKPRQMGDANYRAGISRNLGVKHASGDIVCFLDSDILTPNNFVADLIQKHVHYDVIQCQRLNLTKDRSNEYIHYDAINPKKDIFHTDGGYWDEFHQFKDWGAVPFFWKYTCTYGLSMKLETFKKIGWIKRGFIFYGFEDTELGYRLAKAGYRFHLNDMVTYHLYHFDQRSEFGNAAYLRERLLGNTARIFYLNLLEPDVFEHFKAYMHEAIPFSAYFRRWMRTMSGQIDGPIESLVVFFNVLMRWNFWPVVRPFHKTYHLARRGAGLVKGFALSSFYNFRTMVWKVAWTSSWPFRKFFYFSRYQIQYRLANRQLDGHSNPFIGMVNVAMTISPWPILRPFHNFYHTSRKIWGEIRWPILKPFHDVYHASRRKIGSLSWLVLFPLHKTYHAARKAWGTIRWPILLPAHRAYHSFRKLWGRSHWQMVRPFHRTYHLSRVAWGSLSWLFIFPIHKAYHAARKAWGALRWPIMLPAHKTYHLCRELWGHAHWRLIKPLHSAYHGSRRTLGYISWFLGFPFHKTYHQLRKIWGAIRWPLMLPAHRVYHLCRELWGRGRWRLVKPFHRAYHFGRQSVGFFQGHVIRALFLARSAAWYVSWNTSWPVRKLFYFCRYQIQSRLSRRRETNI